MSMGSENRALYGPSQYANLQNLNMIPETVGQVGGKTGLSSTAGDSMLAVFEIEMNEQKRPVAIIVLGSDDAKNDVKTLLKYITNNFSVE